MNFFKNRKLLKLFFFCIVLGYVFFFARVLISYAGNNPLNRLNTSTGQYVSLFPQGWAFFTKSPREPVYTFYRVKGNSLERYDLRGFKGEYYFGASRMNRMMSLEMSIASNKLDQLKKKLSISKRIPFRDDLNKYVSCDTLLFNKITKDKNNVLLSGRYVIAIESFLPWSMVRRKEKFTVYENVTIIPLEIN